MFGQVLSVDAVGNGWSHGHIVTKPSEAGSAAVTVIHAESASLGTPPRPATRRVSVAPEAAMPAGHWERMRVSSRRVGACTSSWPLPADHP